MATTSYFYKDLNGLIEINTLGPSERFYYKVQKPISINMSNFACKIAFYGIDNRLIYYRHNILAHWLEPWQKIELVKWSQEGNLLYFFEYQRNAIYESVFLNLKQECCYRINEMKDNFKTVRDLKLIDRQFDEMVVINKLGDFGFKPLPLIKDRIPAKNFMDIILNRRNWYPKI